MCEWLQVVDSPFARLTELMMELVVEQKLPIPKPFMKVALGMMRRSVRKRAAFDLETVNPLDTVPQAFIPALFGQRLPGARPCIRLCTGHRCGC